MKSTYVGRGEMAHMIAAFESNFTGGDLMKNLDAPQPVGNFVTYYSIDENTHHVIYPHEGHLHEIWWPHGASEPSHGDLTDAYGLPLARFMNGPWRTYHLVAFPVPGTN